jgi:peptidoglycan hydrolase-like protein with peptidoglycan-binding domain
VVRLIQENLAELGAYRGPLDGIAGAGTVTAIQNYAETRQQG